MATADLIFAFYKMHDASKSFKQGKLIFNIDGRAYKVLATSGLEGHQNIINCGERGLGGIPPCKLVGLSTYRVLTTPIAMPLKKGIKGNFYPIEPFKNRVLVQGIETMRGDFGCHKDEGQKGTAGCIGIPPGKHWELFEGLMWEAKKEKLLFLPLYVPVGF